VIGAVAAGVLYTALNAHRKAAAATAAENRAAQPASAEGALS
jgi:glycerol uptake facilitator protein